MKSTFAGLDSEPNTSAGRGTVSRRNFLRGGLAAGAAASFFPDDTTAEGQQVADDRIAYPYCGSHSLADRLDQGPFFITQDQGEQTIAVTTPSQAHIGNFGLGLVGYTWEENGPSLRVRKGLETLEQSVERMASLPFVDVLYIRCDWRDVQSRAGRLDLNPVWGLTLDAARRHGLRVAFRIQLSNPEFEPARLALPDFLHNKIPLVSIGRKNFHGGKDVDFLEPRYDDPAFQRAFLDLNELLAARFDGDPQVEWMDMMMYGFWGEGHTENLPSPFPDFLTAEKTFLHMTQVQLDTWKKTQLAVNTQPDISHVGNSEVLDLAMRSGCWLRSDSIIDEEPIQIEQLGNRPPWLATIMEDGAYRAYDMAQIPVDRDGVNLRENAMMHVLDIGANYWSLWTEAENLAQYDQHFPNGFRALEAQMGYRIRPAWIWQRKRWGTEEIIVGVANRGVAGIPGVLRLTLENADGSIRVSGTLDPGHPYAGKVRQASLVLPPGLGAVELKLTAHLETKANVRRPVQWACEQRLNADGSFPVRLKGANAPGWD
ncbi:MAG: hypothetical protein ACYCRE_12490 [Acidobacteriaceae bacterium]